MLGVKVNINVEHNVDDDSYNNDVSHGNYTQIFLGNVGAGSFNDESGDDESDDDGCSSDYSASDEGEGDKGEDHECGGDESDGYESEGHECEGDKNLDEDDDPVVGVEMVRINSLPANGIRAMEFCSVDEAYDFYFRYG